MISMELPTDVERHLNEVVKTNYHGDLLTAITSFLRLHEKYGWKEQLRKDVNAIRAEAQRQGGISEQAIDDAITRYRKEQDNAHG